MTCCQEINRSGIDNICGYCGLESSRSLFHNLEGQGLSGIKGHHSLLNHLLITVYCIHAYTTLYLDYTAIGKLTVSGLLLLYYEPSAQRNQRAR